MNKKGFALLSTISNTFCDFTLDIAVNKYNMYQILLGSAIGSLILQAIYRIVNGFKVTFISLVPVVLYGICMLLGYTFYVMSLKKLPVGLTSLIESGNLFIFLFLDCLMGVY